jgi:hypothetical protein
MGPCIYVIKRSCINWLKKLKEKPAVIVGIAVFFFIFIKPLLFQGNSVDTTRAGGLNILYLIFFGLSLFFVGASLIAGLSTGTSFFTMSDVNLMFTSPISSNKILLYGIIKQMGRSIVVSVFMLFQIANLRANFTLSIFKSVYVIIIYMMLVFISQMVSLVIYSFTNGNQRRKSAVKYTAMILLLIVIAYIVYGMINRGTEVIQEFFIFAVPVSGWLLGMLVGVLSSNFVLLAISTGVIITFVLAVIGVMIKYKPDYYEDCLINSENAYHARQVMKGERSAQANIKKKIRYKNVKTIKFGGGWGASSFFYRHMVEIKRAERSVLFGTSSVLFLALGVGIGLVAKSDYDFVYAGFGIMCYVGLFLVGVTKLTQELSRHFIYLVPDSPFKKLLYASLSSIVRPFISGILLFLPPVFISGFPIVRSIVLILCFASVNCIYISANIVMHNIFGKHSSMSIIMFIYFLFAVLFLSPAAGFGVLFGILFSSVSIGFLIASLVNFGTTMIVLFICRNLVHNIEFK